jgi:hypothetical protein
VIPLPDDDQTGDEDGHGIPRATCPPPRLVRQPFASSNRIWIGGYDAFPTDMSDYDSLLTAEGIAHTTETATVMAHRWDSGWVPIALTALYQDSLKSAEVGCGRPGRTAPAVLTK